MAETSDISVEIGSFEWYVNGVRKTNERLCVGEEFGKPVFTAINEKIEFMYTDAISEITGIVGALGRCLSAYQTMVTKSMNIVENGVQELCTVDQTISREIVVSSFAAGGDHDRGR